MPFDNMKKLIREGDEFVVYNDQTGTIRRYESEQDAHDDIEKRPIHRSAPEVRVSKNGGYRAFVALYRRLKREQELKEVEAA